MRSRSMCLALLAAAASVLAIAPPLAAQGRFGAAVTGQQEQGGRRAILVGIDEYADPAFATLRFAARDARDLADVLLDPSYGGFESVEILPSSGLDSETLFLRLRQWALTLAPDDLGLIYFSGHGTRHVDERGRSHVFVAATDTRRSDPIRTGIPLAALEEVLATLPASRRVLILDACFTGDGKIGQGDAAAAARALVDEDLPFSERVQEKEARLFATTWGRPALESEALGHGVYTAWLIAALGERFDEADLNGDLVVSVSEAHDFARDRTMQDTGDLQIPMVFYEIVGREDLVLSGDPGSRRRVEMAMVSAYEGPQQGLRLFVDGQEKGAFPRTVLVEPGSHRVEFQNLAGKVIDSGFVTFRKEGVYPVSRVRDGLNGGRHLLSAGYAHTWLPGWAGQGEDGPAAPGMRLAYGFRFPSRVPLLRRLGLVVDAGVGFFPEHDLDGGGTAPQTTLLDVGAGPVFRLDLPFVLLSAQPRFAIGNLFRSRTGPGWVNWVFGAIGGNLAAGFRPVNRLSVQFVYSPMVFDADIQGSGAPKPELMHRLAATVEIGF